MKANKNKPQPLSPFDYLKYIYRKEIPTDVSKFNPIFTNNYLSHNNTFLYFCDILNEHIFTLPKEMIYKLFVLFFGGFESYIDYVKKEKVDKSMEEIRDRIKRLYGWSTREFNQNMVLVRLMDTRQLARKIGLEEKKIISYFKFLNLKCIYYKGG